MLKIPKKVKLMFEFLRSIHYHVYNVGSSSSEDGYDYNYFVLAKNAGSAIKITEKLDDTLTIYGAERTSLKEFMTYMDSLKEASRVVDKLLTGQYYLYSSGT